jgi:hypothetical protein
LPRRYSRLTDELLWLSLVVNKDLGGNMFARMTIEDRFLGFDTGGWAMLFGGFLLAAFIALLV